MWYSKSLVYPTDTDTGRRFGFGGASEQNGHRQTSKKAGLSLLETGGGGTSANQLPAAFPPPARQPNTDFRSPFTFVISINSACLPAHNKTFAATDFSSRTHSCPRIASQQCHSICLSSSISPLYFSSPLFHHLTQLHPPSRNRSLQLPRSWTR